MLRLSTSPRYVTFIFLVKKKKKNDTLMKFFMNLIYKHNLFGKRQSFEMYGGYEVDSKQRKGFTGPQNR